MAATVTGNVHDVLAGERKYLSNRVRLRPYELVLQLRVIGKTAAFIEGHLSLLLVGANEECA